jgi:two-component system, cell cycle response regulator DivK
VPARSPDARVPLVLIVDDNAKNLKLARDVLLAAGFRTLEAATAGEGIALANEHRPDVVLMDLRLPDMDGADVARRLANCARTAAIPVVAFSALAFDDDTAWLGHAGFAGYLEKPIDVEEFPDQVRGYCSG